MKCTRAGTMKAGHTQRRLVDEIAAAIDNFSFGIELVRNF
jgi:hypothetical protein